MWRYLFSAAFYRETWFFIVLLVTSGLGVAWVAFGATYNLYFNNTEQGNNSTATPTVTVSDGKVTSTGANSPIVAPSPTVQEVPAVSLEAPTATEVVAAEPERLVSSTHSVARVEARDDESSHYFRRVRFTSSGVFFGEQGTRSYQNYYGSYSGASSATPTYTSYTSRSEDWGGNFGLGIYLSKSVAVNLFAGSYFPGGRHGVPFAGAELELIPLHIRGFHENFIEGALVLGASTLRRTANNYATIHGGARLSFNFGDDWSLTAAGRANLGYLMAEAGIAYRL